MNIKKIGLIAILSLSTLGLVGCDDYEVGDLLYNGRFEIIETIDSGDCIYEIRDTKEGVHYFGNIYEDTLTPVIKSNGEIKITQKNSKYIEKESNTYDVSEETKKEVE